MPAAGDDALSGLLDGLEGDEREQRRRLLERLLAEGVSVEQARAAIREGRLALLPVELLLTGESRYTPSEIAELTGVPLEQLNRQWQALGMIVGDSEERNRTADDLKAAHRIKVFMDAGLDPESIIELVRLLAMTTSQFAAANRTVIGALFDGDSLGEDDVANVLTDLSATLIPMIGPSFEHVYRMQLREQLRHAATAAGGEVAGAAEQPMAIAFADLVDFTRLGEQLPPEELGLVTGRFSELAAGASSGPVRLVKLIGDAAMFASADAGALAETVLALLDGVAAEGESFPGVRAGITIGPVLPRGGDFYGRVVNIASRVTGIARPGSVLVTEQVKADLEGRFRFSDAGPKTLKGIDTPIQLFRLRDLPEEPEDDAGEEGEQESGGRGRGAGRRPRKRRDRR